MTENLKWFKEMQDLQTDTTKSSISQVENMKAYGRFLVGSDRKRIHQQDFFEEVRKRTLPVTIDLKFCILSLIVIKAISQTFYALCRSTIVVYHQINCRGGINDTKTLLTAVSNK